ncbi:MAG TPA: Ger(x)C family spore germination protein, partial [Firmicutes bacterium]|nr:Ger(x)C family spore germination protein [Bacillota bacterium]
MKRFFLLFLLPALLFCTAGCWNRHEPEELALVVHLGFDVDKKTGEFKAMARIADPQKQTGLENSGGGGNEKSFYVLTAQGRTPFEAVNNLTSKSSRKIDRTHTEVLLISEELASQGIYPLLDFLDRERQIRLIINPFVVKGNIEMLIDTKFPAEDVGGRILTRLMRFIFREKATTRPVMAREVVVALSRPGQELLLPRILVMEKEDGSGVQKEYPIYLSGLAVFHKDKLKGYLNDKESRGCNWINNRITRVTYVLVSPTEGKGIESGDVSAAVGKETATLEVFRTGTELKAEVNGENVKIIVEIKAEGHVQEVITEDQWLSDDSSLIASLNRRLAEAIRDDVRAALDKAQKEYKSDVFGFGNLIYRTLPREWARLEPRWEEIFPRVEVEVLVEGNARRSGLIK